MPKIKLIVEGGKATANPQMAQTLGPAGIDIKQVLEEINKKTQDFKGMKVPVEIDIEGKNYSITIGTPPTSELIKKFCNIEKGASFSHIEKVGNLAIEDVIKIARMKMESLIVKSVKEATKCILGTCKQMGVLVESKDPKEVIEEINAGKYDELFEKQELEVSEEKKKKLQEDLKEVQEKFKAEVEKLKPKEATAEEGKEKT